MLKKIADAAPAALIAVGAGSIAIGALHDSQTIERINQVLAWPWSVLWFIMIAIGSVSVVIGISLRSRKGKVERPQIIGQGLELFGDALVGSAFLVYSLILGAQFPFRLIWPSMCWFFALASVFLGPFTVIVRDIVRAHRKPI